jgi:ParB-like chromosome segregation protein Spo0J
MAMKRIEDRIELVSVKDITPYDKNPRKNDETVDALVKSIRKYGFNQPIVIDQQGVIVKGHTRYKAAQVLGMEEVPAIRTEATAKEIRADRILDNRIADLSKWDNDALAIEMRETEDAITRVLGDFGVQPYSAVERHEVEQGDVETAQEELEAIGERRQELIKVICTDCGEEMYLSKEAVERLK